MIRTTLAAASILVLTVAASAAPTLERVRGTIESSDNGTLTVKTADGTSKAVTLAPDTKFTSVVKASLDDVKDGVFIGTATKGEPPVALEVVLFPDSMRGTGEGHYDWDTITDTTEGGKAVKSSMTNGTIKATAKPMTKSAMTNGTVKSGSVAGGAKKLTVTYDNGKSLDVTVPPSAPIVAFQPADKAVLKAGAPVFVVSTVDGTKLSAKMVAVGKDGVTPPM
jgi:hypothetical protein